MKLAAAAECSFRDAADHKPFSVRTDQRARIKRSDLRRSRLQDGHKLSIRFLLEIPVPFRILLLLYQFYLDIRIRTCLAQLPLNVRFLLPAVADNLPDIAVSEAVFLQFHKASCIGKPDRFNLSGISESPLLNTLYFRRQSGGSPAPDKAVQFSLVIDDCPVIGHPVRIFRTFLCADRIPAVFREILSLFSKEWNEQFILHLDIAVGLLQITAVHLRQFSDTRRFQADGVQIIAEGNHHLPDPCGNCDILFAGGDSQEFIPALIVQNPFLIRGVVRTLFIYNPRILHNEAVCCRVNIQNRIRHGNGTHPEQAVWIVCAEINRLHILRDFHSLVLGTIPVFIFRKRLKEAAKRTARSGFPLQIIQNPRLNLYRIKIRIQRHSILRFQNMKSASRRIQPGNRFSIFHPSRKQLCQFSLIAQNGVLQLVQIQSGIIGQILVASIRIQNAVIRNLCFSGFPLPGQDQNSAVLHFIRDMGFRPRIRLGKAVRGLDHNLLIVHVLRNRHRKILPGFPPIK